MTTERTVYTMTLLVLLLLSGIAVGLQPDQARVEPAAADSQGFQTTGDGVRYTVEPTRLRQGCPGGMDCIPSIDDPRFQ